MNLRVIGLGDIKSESDEGLQNLLQFLAWASGQGDAVTELWKSGVQTDLGWK